MYTDFSGCRSSTDQFLLQKLAEALRNVYKELYANFYAKEPYVLAYSDQWHTYSVIELQRLTGVK